MERGRASTAVCFSIYISYERRSINYLIILKAHLISVMSFQIIITVPCYSYFISKSHPFAYTHVPRFLAIDIPMLIRIERRSPAEKNLVYPARSMIHDEPNAAVFEDDSVRLRRQRRGIN